MNQLSENLKETYANMVHEDDYIPVKGEVCVAKYTVDQVTPAEMNCLIKCFNLSWSVNTRAFNDAWSGLQADSGHNPVSSSVFHTLALSSCSLVPVCLFID
jgi:hypothetical protein